MNDVDWSRVEQTHRARREDIAEGWYQALAATPTFVPLKATQIRQRLIELTNQIIALLLAESIACDDSQAIGAALVELRYTQPEAVSRTLQVLADQLVQGLTPAQMVALQPRLSGLLGEIAAGFLRCTCETILAEQDQIHTALHDQLQASERELRKARDSLEIRIAKRTAELATTNQKLRNEIAERKRTEEELRRRTQELESLRYTGLELTTRLDLEEVLRSVVARAMDLFNGVSSGVALYDEQEDVLKAAVSDGWAVVPLGTRFQRGEGLSGRIWETGEALVLDDYQNPVDLSALSNAPPRVSVLAVPIIWDQTPREEFLGALIVKAEPDRKFSRADVELLRQFAVHAAIAIRNAQLYKSLDESERRYRALFEDSPISLWEQDYSAVKQRIDDLRQQGVTDFETFFESHPELVREYVSLIKPVATNKASLGIYGADSEAELLTGLDQLIPKGDYGAGILVGIAEGQTEYEWEAVNHTLSGEPIDIHGYLSVLPGYEDTFVRVIVAIEDITDRRRAKKALQESELRYRGLFENMPIGLHRTTADGRILAVNEAVVRMLRYPSREALLATNLAEFQVDPQDLGRLLGLLEEQDVASGVEMEVKRYDGSTGWVRTSLRSVHDADGQVMYYEGSTQDITEHKWALEALRESEESYRRLADNINDIVFTVDRDGNLRYINAAVQRFTGWAPEEMLGHHFVEYIHPEDVSTLSSIVRRALAGEALETIPGFGLQVEYRMVHREGEAIWVAARATAVRDAQGKIVGFNGVVRDITQRKQTEEALQKAYDELEQRVQERTAELVEANDALEEEIARRERTQQALQESEERYRTLFEQAPISIAVVDPEGNILTFNDPTLTGFTHDEVLALEDLTQVYYDLDERAEMWSIIREQGFVHRHEVHFTRRDGSPYPVILSVVPIMWEGRRCWQVMAVDISELKQAQARLQRQTDRLAILHEIDVAILSAQSVEETSEAVLHHIRRLLPCQRASVVLFELDGSEGVLIAAVGRGWDRVGQVGRFALNPWLMRQLRQGEVSYTPDAPTQLRDSPIYQALLAEGVHACTCVPLVSQDELIGSLNLGMEKAAHLTAEHLTIIREIADSLAIAIQHARLLQSLSEQRQRLRDLGARLAEVEEAERKRLAQHLHNMVGQNLTALGINLSLIKSQMSEQAPPSVQATLEDSLDLVEGTTERIRLVMADLRPPVLDDYGLIPALDWYAKRVAPRIGVEIAVSGEEPAPRLPPRTEAALFRIAQEALTNVAKHARASQVEVTVSTTDSQVSLIIADDGVGFTDTRSQVRNEHGGWGIINMIERAEALGGCCEIDSVPGEGTRVTVEVAR
jgi:PAS domain S-box-containing protein